ncbi:MAG: alpha/beta fold hydrolase [Phycisphaerales bacterium]|nr:alpha/beta fold hydrolase [Phycisphaerales bacterium]
MAYLILLVLSHLVQLVGSGINEGFNTISDDPHVRLNAIGTDGFAIHGRDVRVYYKSWQPPDWSKQRIPVLLLHGSPGSGANFDTLGPTLALQNRRVYAPNLPGSGRSDWAHDMSYTSQARYMAKLLDQVSVDRVHVVGWSSGGGVALQMADQFPDRVASITMLASIGAQETEGSGSYFFEHVKYAVGFVGLGIVPELIPHFGFLGTFKDRAGWLKAFWDSDQRTLTQIMGTIQTPTLILHGRNDPLVAARGAEQHHKLMPTSRLVMLDASHFLPLMQANETAGYLNDFFTRHDQPGVEPQTDYLNLAPVPTRYGSNAALHWIGNLLSSIPWWAQLLGIIGMTRRLPHVGIVIAMIFVVMMRIDLAVAILGLMLGRLWWLMRGANPLDRPHRWWRWVRGVGFVIPASIVGMIGANRAVAMSEQLGLIGLVASSWLLLIALHAMRLFITWGGRQRIGAAIDRAFNHEYWPTLFVYLPVLSWGLGRVLSGKGLGKMTAVNPGYSDDAGVQDESKIDLNIKLGDGTADDEAVLHCVLIDDNENIQTRINAAIDAIDNDQALGGLPVICKPDKGERGRAVQLELTKESIADYCKKNPEPFVMQEYHPGPLELGVLWIRHAESITNPDYTGPSGFIYAITIKHFPVITGDGEHTLRRLILMHKRYRAQASVFINRMQDQLDIILDDGQELSLGFAGNHAQGAMFTDGQHLITPELSAKLCSIADRFNAPTGGFDIGRFDIRCESLEQLRDGQGFGIVELNGLTSEPTNIYDPDRSLYWAWGVLGGYWKHAEELAQARLDTNTGEPIDEKTWWRMKRALVRVMIP